MGARARVERACAQIPFRRSGASPFLYFSFSFSSSYAKKKNTFFFVKPALLYVNTSFATAAPRNWCRGLWKVGVGCVTVRCGGGGIQFLLEYNRHRFSVKRSLAHKYQESEGAGPAVTSGACASPTGTTVGSGRTSSSGDGSSR